MSRLVRNGFFPVGRTRWARVFFVVSAFASLPFFSREAQATTYHVDATNGVDSHPGTLVNGPLWTSGTLGGALNLDGTNDHVDAGTYELFKPDRWTAAAWVKPVSGSPSLRAIFMPSYSDGWSSGFLLFINGSGQAGVRYGTGTVAVASIGGGANLVGAWHHVAASFDGTTLSLFVDGLLVNSTNASTFGYRSTPSSTRIGMGNGTAYYEGDIDDVGYYDRALAPSEIATLATGAGVSSGLILRLPFDDGSGSLAADAAGNDGLTASTPWRTIAKVSGFPLQPGDTVNFKAGETWRESLTIPSSGTSGSPITFGSYGTGDDPIIDAARAVTGWTPYSGSIHVADVGFSVTQVFVDDVAYDVAHYPDSGYLSIDQNSSVNTELVDNDLSLSSGDVVGADVYIRSVAWRIEKKTVTGYDGSAHRISWSGDTAYDLHSGHGYYLANRLWMLDQPGEWYYDGSVGKLYIRLAGDADPNDHVIAASYDNSGISANGKNFFAIGNIDIRHAKVNGIDLSGSSHVTVRDVSVSSAASHGILVAGTAPSDVVVRDSAFSGNTLGGIRFTGASDSSISGNTVSDTGTDGQPKNTLSGIHVAVSTGTVVENNVISDSGYIGITFSGSSNIVRNNSVSRSCLVLDDCAGIYTWGNYGSGNQVIDNVIVDSIGNYDGLPYLFHQSEGIYLDDNSNGTTVSGNTTENTELGIFLHNSYDNTVTGNTVYKARKYGIRISEDALSSLGTVHDNVITDNVFSTAAEYPVMSISGYFGSVAFGQYDRNTYIGNYYGYPIEQTVASSAMEYSLADWQTASGQDAHSTDAAVAYRVVSDDSVTPLSGNFVTNSTFDAGIASWGKYLASTEWAPSCGLDGGCIHVQTTAASSLAITNQFSLSAGSTYEVSFSSLSTGAYSVSAIVRLSVSPYMSYGSRRFVVDTSRRENSFTFTAPVTLSNARIDFDSGGPSVEYFIDNVSIREVAVVPGNDPIDDAVLYRNATLTDQTVPLGSFAYCDIDNRAAPSVFTLAPFTSRLLLSCFGNDDRSCNNHETHGTAPAECAVDDEGDYAGMDAPYTMGTDEPDVAGDIRVYAGGGFRNRVPASGITADLSITPEAGFSGSGISRWMDVSIDTWQTAGARGKSWTESSETLGSASTLHTVGDLVPGSRYGVSVDGTTGQGIAGSDCLAGICTANAQGRIVFTYSGGYSTHSFDVSFVDDGDASSDSDEDDGDDSLEISHFSSSSTDNTVTLVWETNRKSDSRAEYGVLSDDLRYQARDADDVRNHRLVIGDLRPGTLYFFRIGSEDEDGNADSRPMVGVRTVADPAPGFHERDDAGSQASGQSESVRSDTDPYRNFSDRPKTIGELEARDVDPSAVAGSGDRPLFWWVAIILASAAVTLPVYVWRRSRKIRLPIE